MVILFSFLVMDSMGLRNRLKVFRLKTFSTFRLQSALSCSVPAAGPPIRLADAFAPLSLILIFPVSFCENP